MRYQLISQQLNLDKGTKLADILSGGNKRKLCTGLTLFSKPIITFLDEPTVGLDPIAISILHSLNIEHL